MRARNLGPGTELIYETTVSTVENPPPAAAWLSGAQPEQERPGHTAQPPPRGPQTSDSGLAHGCMDAPAPRALKFARAMRLKQGRDFSRIRRQGQRVATGCVIVNWHRLGAQAEPRLGVVTSRRVGNAVVRSRARRLLREVFRVHQHDLAQGVDVVLVARPSIADKGYGGVEKDFLATMRKAGLLKKTSVEDIQ